MEELQSIGLRSDPGDLNIRVYDLPLELIRGNFQIVNKDPLVETLDLFSKEYQRALPFIFYQGIRLVLF
jgi:hypothetical protein